MNVRKFAAVIFAVSVALVIAPVFAHGDSIGGPTCGTCNGATFTLTYNPDPIASTATTQTFDFEYTVNVAGFNAAANGTQLYLEAIALKPASSVLDPSTLLSAPGAIGNWTNPLITGTLNSDACSDTSGDAFACTQATSLGSFNGFTVGQSKTFTFDLAITVATGTIAAFDSSIKAEFVNANGTKVGSLLSEHIDAPEPSSALFLGLTLPGVALVARRRIRS